MRAFVTASRSGCGTAVTWAGSWPRPTWIPSRGKGRLIGGRRTGVAAVDDRAGRSGEEGRRARTRTARPDDVDPLPGTERDGFADGCQAGADRGRFADHSVELDPAVDARSRSSSRHASALAYWFVIRSPDHW